MNAHRGYSTTIMLVLTVVLSGCRPVTDYNIAYFNAGEAKELEGKQLYFIGAPDSFSSPFQRMVSLQTTLPVAPDEHTPIDFSQGDPFEIQIGPAFRNGQVFVASDGTISFEEPNSGNGTLREHFSDNKVSVLPMDARADGSEVRYTISEDGLVITYLNVNGSTVQFHYLPEAVASDAAPALRDIAITYAAVGDSVPAGVVGLPLPPFYFRGIAPFDPESFLQRFQESDLCSDSPGL